VKERGWDVNYDVAAGEINWHTEGVGSRRLWLKASRKSVWAGGAKGLWDVRGQLTLAENALEPAGRRARILQESVGRQG
jgi:hypothetical protein